MILDFAFKIGKSGCSTVVGCIPCDLEVVSSNPTMCRAFFLYLLVVKVSPRGGDLSVKRCSAEEMELTKNTFKDHRHLSRKVLNVEFGVDIMFSTFGFAPVR